MVEVCFGDSVKASLILAQHCGRDVIASSIGVITDQKGLPGFLAKQKAIREAKKRQRRLQALAVPLGGRREDIAGVSLGLSEGDILSPILPGECPRKAYIRAWLTARRWADDPPEAEDAVEPFWAGCLKDLDKLRAGPPQVRIWLDNTPDARCGILFLADLLRETPTQLYVVTLPRQVTRPDGCVVEYDRGWGEVHPELFGTFLDRQQLLPPAQVQAMADHWRRLQQENAPLRVVESGTVVSTGIDYYDGLIRQAIPSEPCRTANIIGRALAVQKVPTGDFFIARRLEHFIQTGELAILERDGEGFYNMVVGRRS